MCGGNKVCLGNECVTCDNLNRAKRCPGGFDCVAQRCLSIQSDTGGGGRCVNGFQWSYYKLNRAIRDTVTTVGTIPFRDIVAGNWPILNFQPDVALNGQRARYSGLTQTLGIQTTCPPEHARVYGTDAGTGIDYSIIQHIGYFRPKEAGTYTFQVDAGIKQAVYVWLGLHARAGWKNINANLIVDGNTPAGLNTWLRVVSPREVGRYIPIRILYVNAQDCGGFGLTVTGPNNNILVTRQRNSDDGEFLSNCIASADIPAISFDPIFNVDLGLGLGNDGLDVGIGVNVGGLGVNAGLNVGDTGNVGQDIGGNLGGLGIALGSGSIGANQNGTLLNLTVGGLGGLGGLGTPLNGSLLNVTAGGNGIGLGLNGSALGLGNLNLTLPIPLRT
ncbi:hypothetical protein TGAMA5MH_03452 [Trichoderma gamsii]|uniref:GLEYA adhesin domain-containing protein n=1 Tax=Trichoderma gamsii TaxID=398673 RepID=A0A2K0TGK3_9HYPO|nr:hypothetical protein TGAMA5MH_03452 [Trichoderma gamsii]